MPWSRIRLVFIALGAVLAIAAYLIPPPWSSVDFQWLWYGLHPAHVPPVLVLVVCVFALWESRFVALCCAACTVFWLTGIWTSTHEAVQDGLSARPTYDTLFDGWPLILFLVVSAGIFLFTSAPFARKPPPEEPAKPPTYEAW